MTELLKVQLQRIAEKTKANLKEVAKGSLIKIAQKIIEGSPVGNPEKWKANSGMMGQRAAYDRFTVLHNMGMDVDPNNFNDDGVLKRGVKYRKKLSEREKSLNFALPVGKGYVGGHFRANWNMCIGVMDDSTSDAIDTSRGGSSTQARAVGSLTDFKVGDLVYFTNSLPYAQRLEYEGWSKQAPAGMVRIAVAEFDQEVEKLINETR